MRDKSKAILGTINGEDATHYWVATYDEEGIVSCGGKELGKAADIGEAVRIVLERFKAPEYGLCLTPPWQEIANAQAKQ